jgi:hypothetical protein
METSAYTQLLKLKQYEEVIKLADNELVQDAMNETALAFKARALASIR